ncbi:MAG: transcription termination/antitermination factor NusG [Spirochaetales bacterium]|nr:transcription termination/antitermination factor NusG [Spirochaetales bacterium]
MGKGWYVVHTYSGHENKVEKLVRGLMEQPAYESVVLDVKVPVEEVVEIKNGKKRTVKRKYLPGYILVEMDLPEQDWKGVCGDIRRIPGVTGFLGSSNSVRPVPVSQDEIRALLQKSGDMEPDKNYAISHEFSIGETVKVTDGPFEGFSGKIEEINFERNKLRVMVGIFGRSTPVEVDFVQVEKI